MELAGATYGDLQPGGGKRGHLNLSCPANHQRCQVLDCEGKGRYIVLFHPGDVDILIRFDRQHTIAYLCFGDGGDIIAAFDGQGFTSALGEYNLPKSAHLDANESTDCTFLGGDHLGRGDGFALQVNVCQSAATDRWHCREPKKSS